MAEEKIIIKSTNRYKKILFILLMCGIVSTIVCVLFHLFAKSYSSSLLDQYWSSKTPANQLKWHNWSDIKEYTFVLQHVLAAITLIILFFYLFISKAELVVTNKRVFGKGVFGKRIDLPLDSISAIANSIFSGVCVATSAGKIRFPALSNRNEIYQILSNLLILRQSISTTKKDKNNIDDLIKLKNLLEKGIITQEDFEAKKKQLLGV